MTASRYLEFHLAEQGQKTQKWHVYSKNHNSFLGYIKWFGRWRQYAFFPAVETVWNPECLGDISDFIRGLMDDHRKGKVVNKKATRCPICHDTVGVCECS